MGQGDVIDFLRKNKNKWFTTFEISQNINSSIRSVQSSCKILRRTNQIESKYKTIYSKGSMYLYRVVD